MSTITADAVLAFVAGRDGVTLDEVCQQLSGRAVQDTCADDISEIHAALLAAGWRHSRLAGTEHGSRVNYYERPARSRLAGVAPALHETSHGGRFRLVERHVSAITILQDATQAILDRASTRDLPAERSMARTVTAFNALTGNRLSETQGWLFMAVLKAARATAGAHHGDDYVDGASYFGLAGEAAASEAARAAEGACA